MTKCKPELSLPLWTQQTHIWRQARTCATTSHTYVRNSSTYMTTNITFVNCPKHNLHWNPPPHQTPPPHPRTKHISRGRKPCVLVAYLSGRFFPSTRSDTRSRSHSPSLGTCHGCGRGSCCNHQCLSKGEGGLNMNTSDSVQGILKDPQVRPVLEGHSSVAPPPPPPHAHLYS